MVTKSSPKLRVMRKYPWEFRFIYIEFSTSAWSLKIKLTLQANMSMQNPLYTKIKFSECIQNDGYN